MPPSQQPQQTRRIFDFTIPITWVIGGAITVASFMAWLGAQSATNSNKLDNLIITQTKIEKRLDDRDLRLETMRDSITNQQRLIDKLDLRLSAVERDKK